MNNIFTSKQSSLWKTPVGLLAGVCTRIPISLDVCADDGWVTHNFITPEQDGLTTPWNRDGVNWCNPPWSEGGGAAPWVDKGVYEWEENRCSTLFLLPARVGTRLWQNTLLTKQWRIWFLRGRLTFGSMDQWATYHWNKCLALAVGKRAEYLLSNAGGAHYRPFAYEQARAWFPDESVFNAWRYDRQLTMTPAPFDCALAYIGDPYWLNAEVVEYLDSLGTRISSAKHPIR